MSDSKKDGKKGGGHKFSRHLIGACHCDDYISCAKNKRFKNRIIRHKAKQEMKDI